jgi:hypothetical protein
VEFGVIQITLTIKIKIMKKTIKNIIKEISFIIGLVLFFGPFLLLIGSNFFFSFGIVEYLLSFQSINSIFFELNEDMVVIIFIVIMLLGLFLIFENKK